VKQNELRPPVGAHKDRKRVGRGTGSGHGKTAGRGTKGQKARTGNDLRIGFEGGQNPLIQRMPFKRGFTNPNRKEYKVFNLSDLQRFPSISEFTPEVFVDLGLVPRKKLERGDLLVKVLGEGEIDRAITVKVHKVSASAKEKIEAAGGRVEELI